jgi:hypothetical protein
MNSRRYILWRWCGLIDLHMRATGNGPARQPAEINCDRSRAGDRLRSHDTGDKLREDRLLGHSALRHVSEPATKAVGVTHILLARCDDLGA